MPEEISGQKNRNVVCQGRIIRATENENRKDKDKDKDKEAAEKEEAEAVSLSLLAASIVDYKFIR
jgi:hypothetical protein